MNVELENAIKNKIAIELLDYLGYDSIEDLPYNIEYPISYKTLMRDDETKNEIEDRYKQYGFNNTDYINFTQEISIATMNVFEKYFDDEFACKPFTIKQLKEALTILGIDIWDVLEMKYMFNM